MLATTILCMGERVDECKLSILPKVLNSSRQVTLKFTVPEGRKETHNIHERERLL